MILTISCNRLQQDSPDESEGDEQRIEESFYLVMFSCRYILHNTFEGSVIKVTTSTEEGLKSKVSTFTGVRAGQGQD